MPTFAPKPQTQFEVIPEGAYLARCWRFIHIGTVPDSYQGMPRETNKVRLSWELPTEMKVFREGEPAKPLSIDQEYTLSLGAKANLREVVHGMIGAKLTDDEANSFDVETLVGMPCMIQVVHTKAKNGNTYANVGSVMPLIKGQSVPDPINRPITLTYNNWDQTVFDKLPPFIQNKMKESSEYIMMMGMKQDLNEIPF